MNGKVNGHATSGGAVAPNVVQVNPIQAAQFGLMFLARCDMKPAEREAYGIVEGLLQAIASGSVTLAQVGPAAGDAAAGPATPEPGATDSK